MGQRGANHDTTTASEGQRGHRKASQRLLGRQRTHLGRWKGASGLGRKSPASVGTPSPLSLCSGHRLQTLTDPCKKKDQDPFSSHR